MIEFDIEADWILLSTCNYRCHYCFWTEDKLGTRITPPGSIEQAAEFFNTSGLTWLLHLTGGEPFIYPRFVELCQLLTQQHYISINTNASRPNIEEFVRTVNPSRVNFINCGLHIEERLMRGDIDTFVQNVTLVQRHGFVAFVTYVMYPSLFSRFETDFEDFLDFGIVIIPKALQGKHEGKQYPASYTPEQRERFLAYSHRAETTLQQQIGDRKPTINPFLDRSFVKHGLPDYRGLPCSAGHRFVRIRENGDIRRCGPAEVLGNWVNGTFDRRDGPTSCNEVECPYFCVKYAKIEHGNSRTIPVMSIT